jgi:hypothetical protein
MYFRVSPGIWRQKWTEPARYLALYLLTCQHRTLEGLFVLPIPYICADLKWSPESLEEPFRTLVSDGFLDYDDEEQVCLIVKALHYQPPRNPNMVKAAVRRIATVPESRLDDLFLRSAITYCGPLAESLRESLPERYGKPQLFSALLSSAQNAGGREASPGAPPARVECKTCGAYLQTNGDGTADLHCPVCEPAQVKS